MTAFNTKKSGQSVVGLAALAGVAIGAAATLLLTPKKGSATRKQIKDKTRRIGEMITFNWQKGNGADGSQTATSDKKRTTMHVVDGNGSGDHQADKSLAMVNHLKHTKNSGKDHTEPS